MIKFGGKMNRQVEKIISKVILSDRTINIKLIGDSITHGEGGTGFEQNGEQFIEGYSRNNDGYCWANLFKEYMENRFDCKVTNNGCTGEDIEFIIDNFEKLVDNDDDIVICTIGTNNRERVPMEDFKYLRQEYMERFYNNIVKLYVKFIEANIDVIFVANIPASYKNEAVRDNLLRVFHMNDVNDIYMKASAEYGFPFISLYNLFLEYCDLKDISVDSLLADGLHPNDEGYHLIFKLILREFGIGKAKKHFCG